MKFHVTREACCSQDDQLGPLERVYEVDEGATLQELCEAVFESGFLQFTSTHSVMEGELGSNGLVRVFSPYLGQPRGPQYMKGADLVVRSLIDPGKLHFRFVFDFEG